MRFPADEFERPESGAAGDRSSGASLPMPAAAACDESVRVTVWILLLAVELGTEALGAWRGKSPAMFFICCGEPDRSSLDKDLERSSKLAYSLPSWPREGRVTLGGRGGSSWLRWLSL